jgi:hypothetical protein
MDIFNESEVMRTNKKKALYCEISTVFLVLSLTGCFGGGGGVQG